MRNYVLESIKKYGMYAMLLGGALLTSCSDDDEAPEAENEVETFTDVVLIFTNNDDNTDVVRARANDPDGLGVRDLMVLDTVELTQGVTYTLTLELTNSLNTEEPDLGAEILDEDDDHQFFFSFTNNAFANPTGDGNIDNATHALNYKDEDENDIPVGLVTEWTAGDELSNGEFRILLKHQPKIKTATTTSEDGETDFDLKYVLNIN